MNTRTDWTKAPVWFQWSLHEIGIKETPGARSTARIDEYRKIAKLSGIRGDDGAVPWCMIFVNAAFEANGIPGTRSAMARSPEATGSHFFKLPDPELGCVVTFYRDGRNSGKGHVGFYRGETDTHIYVLGGNQGDAVSIAPFRKKSPSFGLSGYYWPANHNVIHTGRVVIRAGAPLREVSAV